MPALSLFLARLLWASLERPFAQLITADWEGRKSEATAAWSTLKFGNPNPTLLFVLVKSVAFSIKRKSKSEPVAIYLSLRRLLYREGRTRGTTHYILMLPCCPFRSLTLFFHSLLSRLFFVCQQILSPAIPSCYPVIAISLKNSTTNGQCYLCLAALCRCRVMHYRARKKGLYVVW